MAMSTLLFASAFNISFDLRLRFVRSMEFFWVFINILLELSLSLFLVWMMFFSLYSFRHVHWLGSTLHYNFLILLWWVVRLAIKQSFAVHVREVVIHTSTLIEMLRSCKITQHVWVCHEVAGFCLVVIVLVLLMLLALLWVVVGRYLVLRCMRKSTFRLNSGEVVLLALLL